MYVCVLCFGVCSGILRVLRSGLVVFEVLLRIVLDWDVGRGILVCWSVDIMRGVPGICRFDLEGVGFPAFPEIFRFLLSY